MGSFFSKILSLIAYRKKAALGIGLSIGVLSLVPASGSLIQGVQEKHELLTAQTISEPSATISASLLEKKEEKPPAPNPAPQTAKTEEKKSDPVVEAAPVQKAGGINFPNNKVGIHLFANLGDISLAPGLVNTNGGDWGWVTFTYDINDRGAGNWNTIFATLREKHLIPILQLSNGGKIPTDDQTESAAAFLASLDWPIKYRFVSAYNEVNAGEYWGWKIDPEGYARVLNKTIDSLKAKNPNFFVMNGAFNASARTGRVHTNLGVDTEYLSEEEFLKRMNNAVPGIFKKLDGWAAHTYPQPEYLGKPLDTTIPGEAAWERGRNTMSSYKWELSLLSSTFGVSGLPVFITEMGWAHREGTTERKEWYDAQTIADYYRIVFEQIYLPDSRVVAVAPFVLKQVGGVDNFSFIKPDGTPYPQWGAIANLPKVKGSPPLN